MHVFAINLLVSVKIALNYFVLHSSHLGDMGLRRLLEDFVDRHCIVNIRNIKRAF